MLQLLLLPFRIARRFLWMIIWYSVYFLLRRPKLFILAAVMLLVGILYAGWAAYRDADLLTQAVPERTTDKRTGEPAKKTEIPVVKGKIEDGNSAFAANLVKQMQPFEMQAYSKAFYGTMRTSPAGTEKRWQANAEVYGSITPGETFKSGYGVTCRRFTELMSVRKTNQRFTGISCLRKDNSWCKLRLKSAPVCDLKGEESWGLWWHNKKTRMNDLFSF